MTETNFVSEEDFEKLLDSIPNQSSMDKLSKEDWHWFFRLQYRCAFRPIEELRLYPENFDCDHSIVTMNETKTGFAHCKCSKWGRKHEYQRKAVCLSSDKNCKKCNGRGKYSIPQHTTIHPWDIKELREYLKTKEKGKKIWPVSRQTAWTHFKTYCELSGLKYFWQKPVRSWKDTQYLLRSSREKIMEDLGAKPSIMDLKMRHKPKTMGDTYRQRDIHALIGWEQEAYKVKVKA